MIELHDEQMNKVEAIVTRLATLVKSRFRCELSYLDLDASQANYRDLHRQLIGESPVQKGEGWLFPVFRSHRLVGCAEVKGYEKCTPREQEQLNELLELYLENTLALTDQLEFLSCIEQQMDRATQEKGGANVIPLHRSALEETRQRARKRLSFALPCLIEGSSHDEIKAMTLELHELSGRYGFLYFGDLQFKTADDLKDLGPVTIYVPDILRLTSAQQLALLKYLSSRPSVAEPQVIAGTLMPYAQLRASAQIHSDLLHRLSVCFLRMDRPFKDYRKGGIAEFFFGSLVRDDLDGRLV